MTGRPTGGRGIREGPVRVRGGGITTEGFCARDPEAGRLGRLAGRRWIFALWILEGVSKDAFKYLKCLGTILWVWCLGEG